MLGRPILVILLSIHAGFAFQASADSPSFRGPNHNGIIEVRLKLLEEPREIWKVENLGEGFRGAPAVVGDRLYINGGRIARAEPFLYCLNANTGKEIWKSRAGRTHSTPVVHKDKIYVQDNDLNVKCFKATNGEEVWSVKMPASTENRGWGHSGSPRVWKDLLIVNYGNGVALELESGEVVWQHEGFAGLATPVIFTFRDKPAVAIFCGDRLIARDARSGNQLWSIPWVTKHGVNACDPLFLDNDSKLYLSSRYGLGRTLYDVSSGTPKEIWSGSSGATYSSSILLNDKLYTLDGSLGRLELESGKRVARGPSGHSMLVVDNKFIVLGGAGELRIGTMDNDEFNELMRANVAEGQTWNVPAYSDGRLFVRNHEGVLVCVKIGEEE